MKYFTKEELEDITNELVMDPTRETLKKLNDKYNSGQALTLTEEVSNINIEPPVVEQVNTVVPETPVSNIGPSIPTMEMPMNNQVTMPINEVPMNPVNTPVAAPVNESQMGPVNVGTFELPTLDIPTSNNQSNEPVAFNGNLWDNNAMPEMGNLMQTTDNFGVGPQTVPTTEVPVANAPFFGSPQAAVNNPIPISGQPSQGPTMLGQLERNYM